MKKSVCGLTILLLSCAAAADWTMSEKTIVTRWARQVSPSSVWQEYPRPQLVRSEWQNLNGLWDYAVVSKTDPSPDTYQGQILVPFCVESALSGVGKEVKPENRIWYRRTFEVPSAWADKRVMLNFEAVDWEAGIWINNAYVGSHKGAYDRFSFDITDYLKKSGPQEIIVSVWDPTSFGTQARGKQQIPQEGIWYTPVSGIWQTVWLEAVPKTAAVREVIIVPDVDTQTVSVTPMLYEPLVQRYEVIVTVLDGDKEAARQTTQVDKTATIKIENPKLWSPDAPFLYGLKLELVRAARENQPRQSIETLTSYFGMRKISLGQGTFGKVLHLNNKPLFHYGTLDQGWWPDGLHTPPSDEAMVYDLRVTKDMGFNMIRKHIKVEPDRWYYWCDKLGIMVWQDMPSGMVVLPRAENRRLAYPQQVQENEDDQNQRAADAAQFEWELRRMIDLRRNAPCVVMWVPFNEGWGQYDTCRVAGWVKAYDPSRLVNAVSGWALRPCGDVYDIHTYQQDLTRPEMQSGMATVIGEFGGIGYPLEKHLWNPEMRNWGYQTYQSADQLWDNYVYKFNQIAELRKKGLSAAVYTQTTDVEGEVNGLITYDREVIKVAPEKLKQLHSVLYTDEETKPAPDGK